MIQPNDERIIKNTKERKDFFDKHPERTWKTNLTPQQLKRVGTNMSK